MTILREEENFVREDLCEACSREEEGCIGSWRSVYPKKEKKQGSLVGTDEFMALLSGAVEKEESERAYPLALYLQRRGVLERVKTLKRKGGDVALFEALESGECFQVPIIHGEFEKETILGQ